MVYAVASFLIALGVFSILKQAHEYSVLMGIQLVFFGVVLFFIYTGAEHTAAGSRAQAIGFILLGTGFISSLVGIAVLSLKLFKNGNQQT